jgi:hypothetical protein
VAGLASFFHALTTVAVGAAANATAAFPLDPLTIRIKTQAVVPIVIGIVRKYITHRYSPYKSPYYFTRE